MRALPWDPAGLSLLLGRHWQTAPRVVYSQTMSTSPPGCSSKGACRGSGAGSPSSSRPQFSHSTFTHASPGAPGRLASMPSTQSTIVGTLPVV